MTSDVGRRAFVGTVAAGIPLLASRPGLLAQGGGLAHDHAAVAGSDPVIDQIVRQIAGTHNAALAGPRGEHTRALAMQLRMLAVYQRQRGFDEHVRAAARDMVNREGRNAILYAEPDREMRRAARQKYGFRASDRHQDFPITPTHAQREKALDALLNGGITPAVDRLAATLERISPRLDQQRRRVITIAQDDDWIKGYCTELWSQYLDAQLWAVPFCLTARYFVWAIPACAGMEGGAAVLLLVYLINC